LAASERCGRRLLSEPYELKLDEFAIDIVGEDNKTIIHHKVATHVVCVFSHQDTLVAARAEQLQLQLHQQQHHQLSQHHHPSASSPSSQSSSNLYSEPGSSARDRPSNVTQAHRSFRLRRGLVGTSGFRCNLFDLGDGGAGREC
jgi:hypothetical protein